MSCLEEFRNQLSNQDIIDDRISYDDYTIKIFFDDISSILKKNEDLQKESRLRQVYFKQLFLPISFSYIFMMLSSLNQLKKRIIS